LGVLTELKKTPDQLREVFVYSPNSSSCLTANKLELLFKVQDWSDNGSNKFRNESRTQTMWRDLLQDLEGND